MLTWCIPAHVDFSDLLQFYAFIELEHNYRDQREGELANRHTKGYAKQQTLKCKQYKNVIKLISVTLISASCPQICFQARKISIYSGKIFSHWPIEQGSPGNRCTIFIDQHIQIERNKADYHCFPVPTIIVSLHALVRTLELESRLILLNCCIENCFSIFQIFTCNGQKLFSPPPPSVLILE